VLKTINSKYYHTRGRYGEVYKGLLNDKAVAVKSIFISHRQYYYNEIKMFSLPHMRHPAIVEFFGAKERPGGMDGPTQYLIITSYIPLGTVSNYLKTNTVDWYTLCRMSHSVIAGIAHLHTEITDAGSDNINNYRNV